MGRAASDPAMSQSAKAVVSEDKDAGVWVVHVEGEGGKMQEFRCSTEKQARQLALVLGGKEKAASARAP
jgi:hypothetical protein